MDDINAIYQTKSHNWLTIDLSWLRYSVALVALWLTFAVVFLLDNTVSVIDYSDYVTWSVGVSGVSRDLWRNLEETKQQIVSYPSRIVYQWGKPFLLVNQNIVPLSMLSGWWTIEDIIILNENPIIIYYRYYDSSRDGTTYIYYSSTNTSRNVGSLVMIGYIQWTYIFSLQEEDWFRWISTMISGQLQTLYTGSYQTIQHNQSNLKLHTEEIIYLPQLF